MTEPIMVMTELNGKAIASETDRKTLSRIMKHVNTSVDYDYMREDGGRLVVISLTDDVLKLVLTGSCYGCKSTVGTQRYIEDDIRRKFSELDKVTFDNPLLHNLNGDAPRPRG